MHLLGLGSLWSIEFCIVAVFCNAHHLLCGAVWLTRANNYTSQWMQG